MRIFQYKSALNSATQLDNSTQKMLKHSVPGAGGTNNANVSVHSLRPPRSLNRSQQPLNVSTFSHHGPPITPKPSMMNHSMMNGGMPRMQFYPTPMPSLSSHSNLVYNKERAGAREALTSLGLLCLGKRVALVLVVVSFGTKSSFFLSVTTSSVTVADIPAENFTQWPGSTATAISNCTRRLCNSLRRHSGPLCPVIVAQPLLLACVCNSVFICRKIG